MDNRLAAGGSYLRIHGEKCCGGYRNRPIGIGVSVEEIINVLVATYLILCHVHSITILLASQLKKHCMLLSIGCVVGHLGPYSTPTRKDMRQYTECIIRTEYANYVSRGWEPLGGSQTGSSKPGSEASLRDVSLGS
jgi:hypothetical protein